MVGIMAKRRSGHSHGHYCKICGEYKANEKFSGKGHAAHICKSCSRLSPAEKAEAMTINRLMDLPMGRLSASNKAWLKNRLHDQRPEVAAMAREVYRIHFPYAERNAQKKTLVINTLSFELHTTVYNEYCDAIPVNRRFTANRITGALTMHDFESDIPDQTVILDGQKMSKLLRWIVHTLEIFMWPEDYNLSPESDFDPFFEVLPEHWDEQYEEDLSNGFFGDEDSPVLSEQDIYWSVQIEYKNGTSQEIISYQNYLPERPEEL